MKIDDFTDIKYVFGCRVKFLRNQRGLSIEDLALRCNIDPKYLGEVERGKRNIGIEKINAIAEGLNISLEELFRGV